MITASIPTREQLEQIVRELAPDVVRIRCQASLDWSGDSALYFRVILSDDASAPARLWGVTEKVRSTLFRALDLSESDPIPYFRFRSDSEQAKIREQSWE
ncbi:MAG TPA: hypothetical protein VGL53_08595 [Bryobacteraceae bacterium]|jgi:hypothetical protein